MRIARHLGVTVDYILDEHAPYPPPAKDILDNLGDETQEEARNRTVDVSTREERILEGLRKLDFERKLLLEAVLQGHRDDVRFAVFLLGGGKNLPGFSKEEKKTLQARFDKATR